MTATDRIRSILATLDADIAALTRLRALVAAALEPDVEPDPPGNSPAPAPTLGLVSEPQRSTRSTGPRSRYTRPIMAALADGPLTGKEIGERIGARESLWWNTFRGSPWFERANSTLEYPALWRLSDAGRAALAGASAGTAGPAASTGPADCAGAATTVPA